MAVPCTRFYDRGVDKDGPVSGAICVLPVHFYTMTATSEAAYRWSPPSGMQFTIASIYVRADAVGSTPSLSVGTTIDGTQIVAAVNITTALGAVTLKSYDVTSSNVLDVRVVCAAGDTMTNGSITITGYVSKPPTALI